ncbi:MAG: exo-alpha-sialidase [Thermoplasmata archaeon YP2-bin.285]|uniref:Exo-alpha-sialidase n=2 Tax=Candidatus Sysuiplasma superficiale TaxID=2823368 RepID=A0A8J7YK39_9ARCH|nr:exo-alpha-sialidase [Candidatus Sysuiplasma superficiale]
MTNKKNAKGSGFARKGEMLLMVGTKKGAFLFRSVDDRRTWKSSGPFFRGREIYHFTYDRRNRILLASVSSNQWGPTVAISSDMGTTWRESTSPPRFPEGSGLSVTRVWHITPGTADIPDRIFLGVEPACLFVSEDSGETWTVNTAMLNHRTRNKWQPGNGGLCLHSILTDGRSNDRIHTGISAVGTMFSGDGGRSWEFQNRNVSADFFPEAIKYPEFGQCVHKLVRNERKPDVLFQQNHCGVFRSRDNGKNWTNITSNLPSRFGFPIALDASHNPRVYVAPLEGDFSRIPIAGRFSVWASDNEGKEWFPLNSGIPEVSYYDVLREGMKADGEDPCGVYFGTTTGQLYQTRNGGDTWSSISDGLPPIYSVEVSAI